MRAVRAVHGDDVGQAAGAVDAVEIGRDPHPAGRVDVIGRMPGIGDRDFVGFAAACRKPTGVARGAPFAIARHSLRGGILGGGRRNQLPQQGKHDRE